MEDTKKLIDIHSNAPDHKKGYMDKLREFIAAEKAGDTATAIVKLQETHEAACRYFNFYEDLAGYSDSLTTSKGWLSKLADECYVVLSSRIHHEEFLRNATARLGVDIDGFKPSLLAYKRMQMLVREEVPVEAAELRKKFADLGLPTGGFDAPVKKKRRPDGTPLPVWAYALIGLVGLAASVATLYFFFTHQQQFVGAASDRMFYVLVVAFGTFVSLFVFGTLGAVVELSGSAWGTAYKLTGPAAGIAVVVLGAFFLPRPASFTLTIRTWNSDGTPVTQGSTTLYLGGGQRDVPIGGNGDAVYMNLPVEFANEIVSIRVVSSGKSWRNTIKLVPPLVEITFKPDEAPLQNGHP